jgi:pantetheine-phosphate adenylyltransferase
MHIAVYPGSFDPCTNGHLDIITRAAGMFEKVIVAALINEKKHPIFTLEERVEMLKRVTSHIPNVEIVSFSGLLAEFMRENNYSIIVKGLRAVSDFEYEFQMALTNSKLNPEVETLFLTTRAENMYLSSSMVRQIASMGGDISGFVPDIIHKQITNRLKG